MWQKRSVTQAALSREPLSRFYQIFTSSRIYYYRTDAWYHGIYLLNRYREVFPIMFLSVICPITDLCSR